MRKIRCQLLKISLLYQNIIHTARDEILLQYTLMYYYFFKSKVLYIHLHILMPSSLLTL